MTSLVNGVLISIGINIVNTGIIYSNKLPEGVTQIFLILWPVVGAIITIIGILYDLGRDVKHLFSLLAPLIFGIAGGFIGINFFILYKYIH